MNEVITRPARSDDLNAVRALVAAAGLPDADVADHFPRAYVVLEERETVIGSAGLEVHGESGLLRSVAVVSSHRGTGLGRTLTEDRLQAAEAQRLRSVYLLTTTAPEYFARLGFERVARESVPAPLQRSSEFSTVCPASAICMVKRLAF
jgi:amino-acid N-acetyltransferase